MTTVVDTTGFARPISADMFDDLFDAAGITNRGVTFAGSTATFDADLTPAQAARVRLRLTTADAAAETLALAAYNALAANQAFLAIASPTSAQAITQVQALTRQMDALIRLAIDNYDDGT